MSEENGTTVPCATEAEESVDDDRLAAADRSAADPDVSVAVMPATDPVPAFPAISESASVTLD